MTLPRAHQVRCLLCAAAGPAPICGECLEAIELSGQCVVCRVAFQEGALCRTCAATLEQERRRLQRRLRRLEDRVEFFEELGDRCLPDVHGRSAVEQLAAARAVADRGHRRMRELVGLLALPARVHAARLRLPDPELVLLQGGRDD